MSDLALAEVVDNTAYDIGQLYLKGCACQVESIRYLHSAGMMLQAKKDQLPHGEWLPWLQANWDVLGFTSDRTARRLLALAKRTPASDLDSLSEEAALEIGRTIWGHGEKEVVQFNLETPQLPEGKYHVIYADPPWQYSAEKGAYMGQGYGAAADHYPTMSMEELTALPVGNLAEDVGVMFMWATSPLLPEQLGVLAAWGFAYKAAFIWDKVKHNLGHYNSVRHEFLLIGTRGSFAPRHTQLFDSVQTIERSDEHSEKPEEFRGIIETLYPDTKKIELFRRGVAPAGWDVWGNESR